MTRPGWASTGLPSTSASTGAVARPAASTVRRQARRMLRTAVDDLARLVLPVGCPGCGTPDVTWCTTCLEPHGAPLRRRERGAPRLDRLDGVPPLPVWSPAHYTGPLRDVVVAWKDRGRADLDTPLGEAARRAGERLASALAAVGRGTVLVVAAPTTGAARRARGRDPVAGLARSVATGLAASGCPARTADLLVQRRRARDQVGLGARARGARLDAVGPARGARARRLLDQGAACLLVDDVLTTGATLAACEATLAAAGMPVLGAYVLAATPAPGERR